LLLFLLLFQTDVVSFLCGVVVGTGFIADSQSNIGLERTPHTTFHDVVLVLVETIPSALFFFFFFDDDCYCDYHDNSICHDHFFGYVE